MPLYRSVSPGADTVSPSGRRAGCSPAYRNVWSPVGRSACPLPSSSWPLTLMVASPEVVYELPACERRGVVM
jgi:hypothetical protein